MNSGFGEGWLAYGHTLFYVEEHEQAMNCYLRVFIGGNSSKQLIINCRPHAFWRVISSRFSTSQWNIVLPTISNWPVISCTMLRWWPAQMPLYYMNKAPSPLWSMISKVREESIIKKFNLSQLRIFYF